MRRLAVLFLTACGADATPLIAEDYARSYTEVRNCRSSSDHDLHKIRVLADPTARDPYTTRTSLFPLGAILVKEEYDFADSNCTGDIINWTVMQRIDGDWRWQKLEPDGGDGMRVVSENDERCINCHSQCGVGPDGYEGTCAVP